MSDLEQILRDAFADTAVDFISAGRTLSGDFFASVKRNGRGYGVHYAKDPGDALVLALTAPDGIGKADVAFRAAKAAAVGAGRIAAPPEPPMPAVDADLFG